MINKEQVKAAVEYNKKCVNDQSLSPANMSRSILIELSELYLADKLVVPATQDEIVEVIRKWIPRMVLSRTDSPLYELATALCGFVKKK